LTIVALVGALTLAISDRRIGSVVTTARLMVGAGVLALIFLTQFSLYGIIERLAQDPLQDARIGFNRSTLEAAMAYMPLGSGLGTFVPVYAMFETPEHTMVDVYANHAHNDILELWLTTGAVGLVLMGMFVVWFGLRSVEIWRGAPADGASELDLVLTRAATIIVALLVAHSFVDYPLRTGAVMAIMAFACALLIEPPFSAQTDAQTRSALEPKRQLPWMERLVPATTLAVSKLIPMALPKPKPMAGPKPKPMSAPKPTPVAAPASSDVGALPSEQRWGMDIDWPDEWSKPSKLSTVSDRDKPPNGSGSPKGS